MKSEHILFKKSRSGSLISKSSVLLVGAARSLTPHIRSPPLPRAVGVTGEIRWGLGQILSQLADRICAQTTNNDIPCIPSLVGGH
jgi:hypothetical protein